MRKESLALLASAALVLACGSNVTENPGSGGSGGTNPGGGGSGGINPGGGGSGGVGLGGSGGTGGTPEPIGAQPPPPPDDGIPGDGPGYAFVIDELFVGDKNSSGSPDPGAWKTLGFNLDNLISTTQSNDLCQPQAGGSPNSIYPDGDDGIDNAWGKLQLPIWSGLSADFSDQINEAIDDGEQTYLIEVPALGIAPNYVGLEGRFFIAAPLGGTPTFDGSDVWPIGGQSLNDLNDPSSAKWAFASSYVNSHTFVASPAGDIEIALSFGLGDMPLIIHHAVVAMTMTPDRSAVTQGVIGGVIDAEEYIQAMQQVAGSFDPGLCSGTTFDSLADQIRQSTDILIDGTQDPSQTCNGISIGLGFTASAVQLGGVAAPPPPPPNPCN
jgi:hypothetical protein